MTRPSDEGRCDLCGEPMPEGESMFRMHGYSGPCPAPPLPKPPVINWELLGRKLEADLAEAKGTIERVRRERNEHSEWRQKLAIKLNDAKAALAAAQAERDTFAEDNRRHTDATNRMMDELAAAKALLQDVLNECACKGRIVSVALVDRIAAAIAGSKT